MSGRIQRAHHDKLTRRELQVLQLVTQELSNKAIAVRLGIAEATVEFHMKNLQRKLKVFSKVGLAIWAVRNGLDTRDKD